MHCSFLSMRFLLDLLFSGWYRTSASAFVPAAPAAESATPLADAPAAGLATSTAAASVFFQSSPAAPAALAAPAGAAAGNPVSWPLAPATEASDISGPTERPPHWFSSGNLAGTSSVLVISTSRTGSCFTVKSGGR
ncbi:unnamed protein product [Closterium sp. Naga37s-1]|nr:unnamed protein product [Closterium sp. Naga37s-1]